MTRHQTVQSNPSHRAPASPASQPVATGPGKVQPVPAPPRPATNDKINVVIPSTGSGNLGPA